MTVLVTIVRAGLDVALPAELRCLCGRLLAKLYGPLDPSMTVETVCKRCGRVVRARAEVSERTMRVPRSAV